MGATASGGVRVLNPNVVHMLGIPAAEVEAATRSEQFELRRRECLYRGERLPLEVRDRTIILVNDALATGSTMLAAVKALRAMRAARAVVAVPTATREAFADLRREADDIVCATTAEPLRAVGQWYADAAPTSDAEVCQLLERASERAAHVV